MMRVWETVSMALVRGSAIAMIPVNSPSTPLLDARARVCTRHCCPRRLELTVKIFWLMASSRESVPRTGTPYSAAVSSETIWPDGPSRYWTST